LSNRMTNDDQAALMTVTQVANLDNCSTKTVRRAISAGLLETLRIGPGGRAIRITREAHAVYRARLSFGKQSPLKSL
jgi:excisionase family DNA binding protein